MHVRETIANRNGNSVTLKIGNIFPGPSPRNNPDNTAARKQLVPTAVSQLKSNLAFSGVGFKTTGCARETALCRYGTSHPPSANAGVVALPFPFLFWANPRGTPRREGFPTATHPFPFTPPLSSLPPPFRP